MAKATWMVRAEAGGVLFERFKSESFVAMGLSVGSLESLRTRKQIADHIRSREPDWSEGKIAIWAGMLLRFQHEIAVGDAVITYDPSSRVYLVGTVTSECIYDEKRVPGDPFTREVKWRGEVPRDALSVAAKNSLGAIATLFRVPKDVADELETALKGEPKPGGSGGQAEEVIDERALLDDVHSRAMEFIKDRVIRLDWDDMQHLVAGLLRAMGYKTQVSPAGPDRGRDIVASPDGFGFENPRIVVEVKHRTGSAMGSQEIRSFLGGRHANDKGLYVSTGGFTKDARYEADRATIPLTLMDVDDLVKAVVEYYDRMDIETQRLLPLRKLYWPG
jgi:restriction system protein